MGIPHLITFLQPYATLESLAGRDVVIDGPAFAYHVYYLCLGTRSKARNPFEAAPSYAEIGDTAIRWLDGVRGSNATIKKIYFDGFLPPSKLGVRLGRLVDLTRRLSNYYHANPTCHISTSNGPNKRSALYGHTAVRSALTALPPVPFLVPAVLEALKSSDHYKDITEVVPGEADLYCSKYLSLHGGVVFTGDSDLLVHDLGQAGAVSFFKDVQIPSEIDSGTLRSEMYHPAAIAKRLSIPKSHGLCSLAFEIFIDHHGTFPRLLAQAKDLKAVQVHTEIYKDFRREYIALSRDLPEGVDPSSATAVLRSLDPRISEYVLQFPHLAEIAGQTSDTPASDSSAPRIFLPFLLDCAVRTNAWEMSTATRRLAYGLMNLIVPGDQQRLTVFEHKKQHDESNGRELQLPTKPGISEACVAVLDLLVKLRVRLPPLSETDFWIAVAVYQEIEWSHSNSKAVISKIVRQYDISSASDKISNWDIIQLFAQIQSSYYSFRILKQVTSLLVSYQSGHPLPETILQLHQQLENLPHLSQLKDLGQASSIIQLIQDSGISTIAFDILGLEEQKLPEIQKESRKAIRKKRKKDQVSLKSLASRNKSSNPFELLGVE